jgi:transposase
MDPYHDRVLERERGAVEDCVAYHGRSFAPAWEGLRGGPVEEVAQLVALNTMSVGNTLRSLSSEDGRAEMLYLPPYSPDMNPIEQAFSKVKGLLRRAESRTREALIGAMGRALDAVSARDARGFFGHCGYRSVGQPL